MSIEVRPQPRFRMWDVLMLGDNRFKVIGIEWSAVDNIYRYSVNNLDTNGFTLITESDHLRLLKRPEVDAPDKTPRQKADRLRKECVSGDDKGWFGRQIEVLKGRLDQVEIELKQSRQETVATKELIHLFGTLCASKKEGE